MKSVPLLVSSAITQSEITIKNAGYEKLGLIPSVFSKLGIKMERRGDDIFIPKQESYEIQNFIDGSILTISDFFLAWIYPRFTINYISSYFTAKKDQYLFIKKCLNLDFSL